jgi:hypothetical protein
MRLSSYPHCRQMPRRLQFAGVLCLLIGTLVAGCAELRPVTAELPVQVAGREQQTGREVQQAAAKLTDQPMGKLLAPVKGLSPEDEVPPIGRLGFAAFQKGEQLLELPSVPPKKSSPKAKLVLPPAVDQQPAMEEALPNNEAPPADIPSVLQGDTSKTVPLTLEAVLRWTTVGNRSADALMEAANTYVDLLTARATAAVTARMEAKLEHLLQKVTPADKPPKEPTIEVVRIQAELEGLHLQMRKSREAAVIAAARLIYLLGLDPASAVTSMEQELVPLAFIDEKAPLESLVSQAMRQGPGIREMDAEIQSVNESRSSFSTGWSLVNSAARTQQFYALQGRFDQLQNAHQDLRAKLSMAVQEAREEVLSGHDRLDIALKQQQHAGEAYERIAHRFTESPFAKDRSPTEVLLALHTFHAANLAYVTAARDHARAHLRLAILTGVITPR